MGGRTLMRHRAAWVMILAPAMSLAGIGMATAGQASVQGQARMAASHAVHHATSVKPNKVNQLDCNGLSTKYKALKRTGPATCTDPFNPRGKKVNGKLRGGLRFEDNDHYIGHDEPSVKFISHSAGSGNTMTYLMKLPVDPKKAPTATGSVTKYGELSIAPWFGLPLCDPNSYPQNGCTPHSDQNTGLGAKTDAGSAFMELQFYAPGFTPFQDNVSCTRRQWCSAMTIDSLEGTFNFAFLNPACTEPVNFAYLQRNGVPAGPPSPQLSDNSTLTPNGQTLKMNPGDVLRVSISDPLGGPNAGFTTRIHDLTTHQTGFMIASAKNGFMNTNLNSCAGTPHTFHAEYATTEGTTGPVACPSNNAGSGLNCEFSDGACFKKGTRTATIDGVARQEHMPVAGCLQTLFQNGDLDFDGTSYQPNTWPNGGPNHPTAFRYIGPFDRSGHLYPQIQFESNVPVSEILCDVTTGAGCTVKPQGSEFYPFFTLNNSQKLAGTGAPNGACVWNFGNFIPGVTQRTFGRDAQYGSPDVARFGGTNTSPVMANPATTGNCSKVTI